MQNAPQLFAEESQYQPQYNAMQQQMEQSNIGAYAQQYMGMMPQAQQVANLTQQQATQNQLGMMQSAGPAISKSLMASSPQYAQLASQASAQMGAGLDPNLMGVAGQLYGSAGNLAQPLYNLASQAGSQMTPINQQLQTLGSQQQIGSNQSVAQLGQLQQDVLANSRSDIFNATKGNVMSALGNLDPLTQQMSNTAQQQLSLGGGMSPQMAADVAQQQRAAYSARGMLQSTGSIGAEIMGQQQMQQQLLGQREQFAGTASQLVQNEQQQRTQNALGLTSTDIAATQANQQLGANIGQNIAGIQQANTQLQGGLQAQIAANLQNATQQQGSLLSQAGSAYTGALQSAGGLYQSALQQQLAQQQFGANIGQYLTGQQTSTMNAAMGIGAAPSGGQISQVGAGLNAYGTGGPSLFQSSGMLGLTNQNQMAGYNANMAAQMSNASAASSQQGALIGAGAGIAGAAIGGIALF